MRQHIGPHSAVQPGRPRAGARGRTIMQAAELLALAKTVVLVGLMGAGKTCIGKRLAQRLGLAFIDADAEIEKAAGCTIADIFKYYGEEEFRDGERRVILRLLDRPPHVLATGGGAFMDPTVRARMHADAISVWLRADLDLLVSRVARKGESRPLIAGQDARAVLARLMEERYPVYAEADITIEFGARIARRHGRARHRRAEGARRRTRRRGGRAVSAPPAPRTLRVALGARSYDILVGDGLIADAAEFVAPLIRAQPAIVVTDETVAALHLGALEASLAGAGIAGRPIVLPPGEETKSFAHLEGLIDQILAARPERRSTLIALGGGVIGDITGFAAAIVLRGIDYIQVPTTLLSQVDLSVGGKTAIDSPHGKNLIGAFHQPRLVLADMGALATLPRREILAGYAEVVKYGLLGDPAFFAWCEANGAALVAGDAAARQHAVLASCRAKAEIVAEDEREEGRRALLNLGHTFGHALEAATGFGSDLLHGEAVAIGMDHGVRAVGAAGPLPRRRPGSRAPPLRRGGAAHRRRGAGQPQARPGGADRPHAARQEGARRRGDLHPGARHRPGLHRPQRGAGRGRGDAGRRPRRVSARRDLTTPRSTFFPSGTPL